MPDESSPVAEIHRSGAALAKRGRERGGHIIDGLRCAVMIGSGMAWPACPMRSTRAFAGPGIGGRQAVYHSPFTTNWTTTTTTNKQTNKWERGKDSSLSSEKDESGGGGGGVKAITIDCCWSACLRTKSSVVPKVPHPLGAPLKFGEMAANHRRTRRCR